MVGNERKVTQASDENEIGLQKVLLLGDEQTGKTSIIYKFIIDEFPAKEYTLQRSASFSGERGIIHSSDHVGTMAMVWQNTDNMEHRVKQIIREPRKDPFSQLSLRERIGSLSGHIGLILIYDITRESTFDNLDAWLKAALELTEYWREYILDADSYSVDSRISVVAVVGNKIDLKDGSKNTVDPSIGKCYTEIIAKQLKIPVFFMEISAKTGQNIHRLFSELTEIIVNPEIASEFNKEFSGDISSTVRRDGWFETKNRLVKQDRRKILEYLGYPKFIGIQRTSEEILSAIPDNVGFLEGITELGKFLMKCLEEQVEQGGLTFDLDIEWLADTEAARFIPDIIDLRRKEIQSLQLEAKPSGMIETDALWNTYYGRELISVEGYRKEVSTFEVVEMLAQLEDSGISIDWKRVISGAVPPLRSSQVSEYVKKKESDK